MRNLFCFAMWIFCVKINTNKTHGLELNSSHYNRCCDVDFLIIGGQDSNLNQTFSKLQKDLQCNFHIQVSLTYIKNLSPEIDAGLHAYDVVLVTNGEDCSVIDAFLSNQTATGGTICIDNLNSHSTSHIPTPFKNLFNNPASLPLSDILQKQLQFQGWQDKTVHIIIDSGVTGDLCQIIFDIMENLCITLKIYIIDNNTDTRSAMTEIFINGSEVEDFPHLMFLGGLNLAVNVFQQLKTLLHRKQILHTLESEWLLITSDETESYIDQISHWMKTSEIDNVAVLQLQQYLPSFHSKSVQELIMDTIYWKAVNKCERNCFGCCLFNNFSQPNTAMYNLNRLQNSSLLVEVMKQIPSSTFYGYSFYTSKWTQDGAHLEQVTSFCEYNGLDFVPVDLFPLKAMGLNGRQFVIGTIESSPFVMRDSDQYYGICIDMLHELSIMMNFTYTIERSPDGEFGVPKNGSWTGLIGALMNEDIDLAFASLTASSSRLKVVDFVNYFWEFGSILVRMPQKEDNAYKVIMQPFHGYLWIAIFVTVPLAGFVAWLLSFTLTSYVHLPQESFFSYTESLWYVVGALLTQGGNYPKLVPTRCFIGCWWLFSVVIVAAYGGSLYSFLTINLNVIPFETGEEMISSDYKWGTTGGSFYVTELQNANGGILQDMWKGMEKFSETDSEILSKNKDVHYSKVKMGGYALISDRTPLQRQAAEDTSCELTVLNYRFKPMPLGIAIQQNSPFKRMFTGKVLRLQESGLLVNWQQKWWPKSACQGLTVAEGSAISLLDIQSAFYVLMTGVCLACVALLFEALNRYSSLWRTLRPW